MHLSEFGVSQKYKCLSIPSSWLVLVTTGQKIGFVYFSVLMLVTFGQVCVPLWPSDSQLVWRAHMFITITQESWAAVYWGRERGSLLVVNLTWLCWLIRMSSTYASHNLINILAFSFTGFLNVYLYAFLISCLTTHSNSRQCISTWPFTPCLKYN